MRSLKALTGVMASVWIVLLTLSVLFPDRGRALRLVEVSLLFPAWYYGLSFWKGGLSRRFS